MIIYVITNKINGKQYVGQTVQALDNRWSAHKSDSSGCLGLKSAFTKYGIDNFTIEQIAVANSLEQLNKMEKEFIKNFNTLSPNGYNLTTGGEQRQYSEESRAKMSLSHIGKKLPEHVRKMKSDAWKSSKNPSVNMTQKHRNNLSIAHIGNSSRPKIKVKRHDSGKIYESVNDAAKDIGVSASCISAVINKKRKHTKGIFLSKVL